MTSHTEALRDAAGRLLPHRDALAEGWTRSVAELGAPLDPALRHYCERTLDALLARLAKGEVEAFLDDEAMAATEAARSGASFQPLGMAARALGRSLLPHLVASGADRESLAAVLLALSELSVRRLEILLRAQEEESARRLLGSREQATLAASQARDLARANDALRRAEAKSQHRADQIALLASVAHRIASILDPERLMQEAAEVIQARMNHTYVAVVVLDDEGVLIGRWAGRPGVGRRSSGRAQGPAGGVIGRALRKRAPQVVPEVSEDPDYHADVPGSRSEMVVPLLEGGAALGAVDFQNEAPAAFDLDDVVAAETLAEFLVVALRNARRFTEGRQTGA